MSPTIDLYFPNGRITHPHIAVEQPDGVVTAGGYRIEVERRVAGGVAASAVRFTSPDGQVVNVCWRAGDQQRTPKKMLADLTSNQLGRVFDKMSVAVEQVMALRVRAVMEAAMAGASDGLSPVVIRANMASASLLLTQVDMDSYNAAAAPHTLTPKVVALLRDNGIPPELGAEFASRSSLRRESEYARYGPYAQQGWTGDEFKHFCYTYRRAKSATDGWIDRDAYPPKAWSRVPHEHALLGLQARMTPAHVRRLIETGEWNSDSVAVLAALRT